MLSNFGKRLIASGACLLLLGAMTPLTSLPALAHSSPKVEISSKDILDDLPAQFGDVELVSTYRCSGGIGGSIKDTVKQLASQSGQPTEPFVTGESTAQPLNCDGHTHKIEVGVPGGSPGFNLGKAVATSTLTDPSGHTKSDTKKITIVDK